uniref:Uncharacterized protein n=1 Tax=Anguilla anguilla TaxID=7936 RepID=A0A0E9TUS9_ANGAN
MPSRSEPKKDTKI